jgi:N-acetylneuraminate synthase
MEFSEPQWAGLSAHAAEKGIVFLSSPFSLAAVEMLDRINVPAWKIGAGEVSNSPLLDAVAETGKPVLLSTGMSPWSEIDGAVSRLREHEVPLAVLQCTSAYPCPPERVGLNVLGELRRRYDCPVGLSDHSGTIFASLAAATQGANIIEAHVTFSRECFGPDVPASLTSSELALLREGVRFIETAMSNPVDKDAMADGMADLRAIFNKSVVAAEDLPAGHRLRREDLAFKKPGTGISAAQWQRLVGRIVKHDLNAEHFFADDDLQ